MNDYNSIIRNIGGNVSNSDTGSTSSFKTLFSSKNNTTSSTTSSSAIKTPINNTNSTTSASFSVVGINVNNIPEMKSAVNGYIEGLQKQLEKLESVETSTAFKGEYSTAIRSYIESVKIACQKVVSQLLVFSDKLDDVQRAYNESDAAIKSNISTDASSLESAYTAYTPRG